MKSPTNSAANQPDLSSLAEYLGNAVAAQVNSQLCATNSRFDKLEDDIARLGNDLTTTLSSITTQIQGLASQSSQSRETNLRMETTLREMNLQMETKLGQMETKLGQMDSRMETRFRKMDSRMDERFNRVDNELRKMAADNNAQFTGINNQFTGLTTHLNSQIADPHESLGKNIKSEWRRCE
ncbi:hypothetical protein E4U36_005769 [Claviceps purpurea]|nr:hypothetical protein E4U36_005769 [Claviceps purpurea]